jgi:hypothetical protein
MTVDSAILEARATLSISQGRLIFPACSSVELVDKGISENWRVEKNLENRVHKTRIPKIPESLANFLGIMIHRGPHTLSTHQFLNNKLKS